MDKNSLTGSLWRHWKAPHLYKVVAYRKYVIEATGEAGVVYTRVDGKDKRKWIRPLSEFMDGRFKRVLE